MIPSLSFSSGVVLHRNYSEQTPGRFGGLLAFSLQTRGPHPPEYSRRFKLLLFLTATHAPLCCNFFLNKRHREEGKRTERAQNNLAHWIASGDPAPCLGLGPFGEIELLRFKEDGHKWRPRIAPTLGRGWYVSLDWPFRWRLYFFPCGERCATRQQISMNESVGMQLFFNGALANAMSVLRKCYS